MRLRIGIRGRVGLACALALLWSSPALAAEKQCPLDLTTCLQRFQRMRERPFMGVDVEPDSLGREVVLQLEPGGPAQRAGIHVGDVLQSIEGQPPLQWFAGKAGWIDGDTGEIVVLRGERSRALHMRYERVPEATFARLIGVHMIEGHLAYMHDHAPNEPHGEKH